MEIIDLFNALKLNIGEPVVPYWLKDKKEEDPVIAQPIYCPISALTKGVK
jgi:hypothetical protein